MKINRNNTFIAAGIAAIAVAGLTIGTSGCFDNSANGATEVLTKIADSTSDSSDTTDSSADADLVTNVGATSIGLGEDANPASGDVSGAVSESAHSDAISADDSSTVIDTSDTPAVEIPSDGTAPGVGSGGITAPTLEIELNPGATVEGSIFFGADGDADASLFLKESGFGGNDIVSVKLVYYVGETKTTTGATLSRTASTIRSIWRAENMNLSNGTMVSIRVTNSKGVTTYTDVVVEITAPM